MTITHWPHKFDRVRRRSLDLRAALRRHHLPPLAQDAHSAPGIITIALPRAASSAEVARALSAQGLQIAWQSAYLQQRNWIQICLMGELHETAVRRLPDELARQVAICSSASHFPVILTAAPPDAASCKLSTSADVTSRALSFSEVGVAPSS